jgi:hypothetical protein
MRTLSRLALIVLTALENVADADPLDDQDLVLDEDITLRLRAQPSPARVDPARLQRATKGAGESARCGSDNVIEGGGVLGILPQCCSVVLAYLAMRSENDGFGFGRQVGHADRTLLADDPHL